MLLQVLQREVRDSALVQWQHMPMIIGRQGLRQEDRS